MAASPKLLAFSDIMQFGAVVVLAVDGKGRCPAYDAKYEGVPSGILEDMILRRDRCVYRETTADSSIKPR